MRATESAAYRDPDRSYQFLYECGIEVLAREADKVWQVNVHHGMRSIVYPDGQGSYDD